jgi:Glycosyltransferase family 87
MSALARLKSAGAARPGGSAAGDARWPFRTRLGPLNLPPKRVRLWGVALAVIGLVPMDTAYVNGGSDWPAFWAAGATVGTPDLVDPARHMAWQSAHAVAQVDWPYPPGVAYLFAPFAALPIWLGFVLHAAIMLALVGVAGVLAARIFGVPRNLAILIAFSWTPSTAGAVMGQNAALAVVLAMWAIDALRRDDQLEAGLACGLLMYKPTLALPLIGLLLLRGQWRAMSVAGVVVAAGYIVSVAAAAGDLGWPVAWWNGLQPWLAHDLIGNADKAVSIPGLLGRVPELPRWLPNLCAGVVLLLALRGLRRAPIAEAGAAACLLAVALGPRVWGYEAGLLLPIIVWAIAGGLKEPWRTRLVFLTIPMGLLWLVSAYTVVSGVAIVVMVATALWLWRWRPFGADPNVAATVS